MTIRVLLLALVLVAALRPRWAVAGDRAAALEAYLAQAGKAYSDKVHMLGCTWHGPGYHSQVKAGTWVHQTRGSLAYALGLLMRGTPADNARAEGIVRAVLALQDTDPSHKTYGIWPWLREEPLAKMAPPDWNWADFCGAKLAQMLRFHAKQLPAETVKAMRAGLGHASRAIVKRNVGPGYTNIAIMGGGVTAAAGELLDDAKLLAYGRDRLRRCVTHARYHGGFNEYNSPTYTMVALHESERALMLVTDPATRESAEALRRLAWKTIAESFHPATGQWAGPHSRSYRDLLDESHVAYLREQTGAPILLRGRQDEATLGGEALLTAPLPCPEDLRERFVRLPAPSVEMRRRFVRSRDDARSIYGTTWLAGDVCLGTVNRSEFWTQRRPLIGYWRTKADPVVVLRLRFLRDGKDFSSMGVHLAQQAGRVAWACTPLRRKGSWHLHLDRPKDGVFPCKDLRLRVELAGKGVGAAALDKGRFALTAGDWQAVVHTAPGTFAGQDVVWECAGSRGRAMVDAVCYHGPAKKFDFADLPEVVLAAALELIPADAPPAGTALKVTCDAKSVVRSVWGRGKTALSVTAPSGR